MIMTQLKKSLGLFDVWVISTGAIISSGIFILPGFAYAQSGPASIFAYMLAALLALTGLLSQAELSTAMPKAGGTYFYITRSMGPASGTVYGLILFLALSLKSAFQLIGMAAFTKMFINCDIRIIAGILIIIFTIINIFGTKNAGRIQSVLIIFVLSGLIIFSFFSFPEIKFAKFDPFFTSDFPDFISTTGFIFISFGGLLKVASLGEEVKDPSRNLPLGMIMALFCVIFFYILTIIIIFGLVDKSILVHSLTPISNAASQTGIHHLDKIMAIVAIAGFSATANTGIMGASRFPLALSRDKLLPPILGYISPKFKTPVPGILVTSFIMIFAIQLEIKLLVKAASCILIFAYIFTCLAVIILRESQIQNYRPDFKSPLYPWIQLVGITGLSILLFNQGQVAFSITLSLMLVGFFIYFFYGRKNLEKNQDHALLHLIARITAREIYSRDLETELKEIIHKRDSIIKDEFYCLAEEARIIDIESEIDFRTFFKIASMKIAGDLQEEPKEIYKRLIQREYQSSTIITPDVAIPHVILPGENRFKLLMARGKNGIFFRNDGAIVNAAFLLFGSGDKRNLHLKTLAAIAQIIKNPDFIDQWLKAKDHEALRDVILLGERNNCRIKQDKKSNDN